MSGPAKQGTELLMLAPSLRAEANVFKSVRLVEISYMNDQDDPLPSQDFFSSFSLKDAWEDVKGEFQSGTAKSKATSTAKLLGKTLWNVGLHVAKNAPAHLAKAKESMEREKAEQEQRKRSLERKSNAELIEIVKTGGDDPDRRLAYGILKERKEAYERTQNA